ncbi:MAG TPA: glycosyltransferase family 39 protein [Candidatus Saccharimonadales bacterium]|nr:glycosyltransferase family 39 protein [Candidatus Saccharimonadales bacterium]
MKYLLKNKINILITIILLIAAFMRLYRIEDYMTFLGDEGRDVLVAYNILHGHFTLLGPTASVGGFYFGPIYYYFMAPALFLANYNPVGPAIMVALIGTATVWLVYKIGKEFFGTATAIVASFFYAISPIVVSYSRSSWNPNPIPFFALLVLWFIYKGEEKKNQKENFLLSSRKDFLLAGIFLGIAIELHFIVAILGVIVILYLLAVKRGHIKKETIKTVITQYFWLTIGFFIGWLPYLGFEFRHGFPNTRSVINFVFHSGKVSGDNSNFFMIVGNVFFRLFGRLVATFPPLEQLYNYKHPVLLNIWIAFIVIIAIGSVTLLIKQIIVAYIKRTEKSSLQLLLVILWLFIGILFFGIYKRQIYDYYFGFMFPLPFLLVANLLVFLWKKNYPTKILSVIIFLTLFILNIQGIPFRYPPNKQLEQMKTIAQFVNEKTDNKPFNFALITGGNSDHAYRYFFTMWNHEPVTIQNAVIDPKRATVTNQLFIVCESLPCKPLGNPLFEIAGFGQADIADHWTVRVVEVYKLVHHKKK